MRDCKSKVSKVKVDYLIVGQGLAGSWLAYEMLQREYRIAVFNEEKHAISSMKAAGIYNPITGRKMVKTWKADTLFPTLEKQYADLENTLQAKFLHRIPIYRPFKTISDQNDWDGKHADNHYTSYIQKTHTKSIGYPCVNDSLGGISLNYSGYVDLPSLLKSAKTYLQHKGVYHGEVFEYDKMELKSEAVSYKGYTANKIIFCEGSLSTNPHWHLPFKPVRGEIMDIRCNLKSDYIINQGVFMIPKEDRFTVGSTYDHTNLTYEPVESGIQSLKERLKNIFTGRYDILDVRAGVRPATHDRKPYIGLHQKYKTLGIFNGFGTKGVSLTPYFVKHFIDFLEGKIEIDKEVDVKRSM